MSDILERLKKRLGEDYVASRQAESAQSTPFSVEGRKAELAKTIPEVKSVLDYAEAAGRDKRWGYNRQNAYDLAVRKAREYEMNFDPQRAIKEALPRLPSPNSDALMGWGADYRSTQARSSDNAAQRMERYEKNQTRIEEINKRLKELEGGGINKAFEITPEGVRENGTSSSGSFEITPEGVKPKTQTENYSDAQKKAIELRAEKSKLESENGQYKGSSGQYTSDLFRRGVANQKKDDKSLGYDVDAMSWFQDGDYEKYYNNSEFIRWWMARDESKRGTNEEYRDWQDEAALLDSTGGRFSHLEYLTNEELQDVFYILHKQGPEEVDQFLADMKPTLDARADMEDRETIENAPVAAKIVGNILSVPVNVFTAPISLLGNVEDLINTGKVNPNNVYNIGRNFVENVRGATASDIDKATGGFNVAGISLGDYYQSQMSGLDSLLGAVTTGGAYTALMGMTAASSEMERLALQDAPTGAVVLGGLMSGAIETITEYVSFETFFNKFMSEGARKFFSPENLKNILLQKASEASEEVMSEIGNTLSDVLINGDRAEIMQSMYAHIREGKDQNTALSMAIGEKALDVLNAAAGGWFSGGMMGTLYSAVNSLNVPSNTQIGNQIIDNDSANILRGIATDLASEESGIALGDKAAKKITRAAENYDKRGTARSLGKLATTVQGEVAQANSSEITNAVKKAGLKGEDANRAETIFNILAETPNFELSDEDAAFIQRDDVFGAYDKLFGQRGSADAVSRYTNEGWNTLKGAVQYGQINESQAARIARNARTEYAFADKGVRTEQSIPGVGKKGNEVVAEAKEKGVDIEPVVAAYNQGVKGEELTVRDTKASPEIGENIQKQAYNAGVLDAATEKANVERYGKAVANENPGLDMESGKNAGAKYTSGEIRRADALGKVTGTKVEIVKDLTDENGKSVNALYDADTATIKISAKATSPFTAALSHETVHRIRDVSEDAYKSLKRFVIANMSKEKLTAAMGVRGVAYGTFDEDFVSEETVADAFGDILDADPSAIDELVKDDRNLGEKIRDVIRDLIIKIDRYLNRKRDLKKMTAEERKAWEEERTEFAELRKKLVQAESRFSSALNETVYSLDMQEKIEDAGTGVDEKTAEIPKVTKFSMKSPVEQTKDLVAVHNLSVSELEKSLDLGGLPMPSIAIIRAGQGHSEYGDVSIVFPKDAIDPQRNKDNKIYSGDAWTPTFPKIEYKINEKVESKIRKKYYDLYYKYGREAVDALYPWGNYAENQLNREGGEKAVFERYADDTGMMNVFLVDTTGKRIEPVTVTKTKEMDDDLKKESAFLFDRLGQDLVDELEMSAESSSFEVVRKYLDKHGEQYDEYLKDMYSKIYNLSQQEAENIVDNMSKQDRYIKLGNVLRFRKNEGVRVFTETDIKATEKAIRDATNKEAYNQWLKELFFGIEGKKGIYNNKERYTPSGNLRSFEALHYEITLDNIIREMKSHENAETMFGGNAVWGAAAKLFKSIDEVKADAGRIYKADYEEYKKIKEKYIERLSSISSEVLGDSLENKDTFDRFTLLDDAAGAIAEAIKGKRTVDSVMRLLREYKYLKNVNEDVARKIIDLADDIASMPTEYFEAKPERAVMFEEAAAVIVPDTTSEETKQRVRDLGSTITEYKAGDEKSRLEALNSVEGVRFSRAISPEDSARYLELAKDPEKNEAELSQMVEVAARKSGFATKAYHLGEKGITAFQSGNFAGLIYFADSVKVAKKAARSTKQVYPVYLKITNPVNTKRTPMNWYDAEDNIKAAEWRRNGNDAIYVKDEAGTSTAVFSPSQIKSADPVTYDADGNVIPLEERFNPENEDIRYSRDLSEARANRNIKKSFAEQIEDYDQQEFPDYDTLIVRDTPKVFRDIGMLPLPMTYAIGHLKDALNNKNGIHLGKELLKKVPPALEQPIAIIDSTSVPGRIVAIIEIDNRPQKTIAAVEIDGHGMIRGKQIDSHAIASIHDRSNAISKLLKDAFASESKGNGGVYYWDKNKASALARNLGVQFPGNSTLADGFVRSIHEPLSKINPRLKNIFETKQFKRWFGKSKAVNKDGSPRILYHRTNGQFTVFDLERSGSNQGKTHGDGIYLSSSRDAFDYAGSNVMELYAAIKKPFEMEMTREEAERVYDKYAAPFHEDKYGLYRPHAISSLMSATKVFNYLAEYAEQNGVKVSAILKWLGYDGVHDGIEWVAFDPAQVKSATDNIGTFDGEEADIKFSRDLTESYEEYRRKYGTIPQGERPFRDVAVPERTAKDKKVAQTVRTVLEAEATPETMVPTIKEMIANGEFSHDVYTDEAALANAAEEVKKAGFTDALTRWTRAVARGKVNKTITAEGWALYNAAATARDTEAALTILRNMVANTRSAAQALQAVRILKKLSPEAQLYNVVKTVDQLIKDAKDRYGRHLDITVDPDLAEDYLNARSQEERDKILQKIYKVIAQQLPTRFIDRWNSWRYLSMLGNPRTHIRNIAGNALFAPIVMTKNAFATGIEAVVSRASGGKLDRTKANIVGRQGAALLSAARADYTAIQDEALGERKYSDASQQMVSDIEKYRPRFGGSKWKVWNKTGGAALDWLNRKNSEALDKEDVWFSRPHYAIAMAQYCKAHGITAEQIRSGKGLDAARAYAIKEAQKATYRDTNVFSQAVSRLGRKNAFDNKFERVGKTLVEGILPFRKTPANILVRGVEYSPLGLLKAMTTDIAAVRMNTALAMAEADDVNVRIENNEKSMRRAYVTTGMSLEDIAAKTGASLESVEKMAKAGKWGAARADYRAKLAKAAKVLTPMTGAEMIDHLSAGLTGTGLVALGALLASFGLVRGHGKDDDKEEKFDQLTGHQNYALELPNGVSVTLDWLAPESLPFFVGVNLFQEWQDKDQGSLEDLLTAIGNTTEPFIEMSCLQSLNDLLDSIGYAKSKGMASLPSILVSMATSYISQGIPTIGGQTERTIEDKRMTTFTDKKGAARDLQYQLGKASAKIPIPGVEYNQIPYIDAWGREESTGILPYRAFSNFVNPAYVKQISADEVEQELLWVYEGADKDGGVFPSRAEQSFTVNGQEFNLNAQEFVKYATVRGQTSYETVGMLTKNDAYRDLPDADKAAAIKDAYSYATVTARTTVGAPYPTSSTYSWVPKAAEANRRGITPDVYILVKNAVSNNGGIPGADGKTIDNSKGLLTMEYIYGIPGLTNAQKRYLFDVFNVGKKVIGYSQSQVESALKEMRGK